MMDVHEGLVVQIEDVEGNIGLGEASPLTAFTGETLDDAARFLDAWLDGLAGRPLRDPLPPGTPASLPPSAAAAVECALLDISANRAGRVLARYISRATETPGPGRSPVPVNAILPMGEPQEVARAAAALRDEGFRTLKLKVGRERQRDHARVSAVRDAIGPGVALRLDANGAWSLAEARGRLKELAQFNIELCEQPVAPGPEALAQMLRLRDETGVAIAADESLVSSVDIEPVLPNVDGVVLKPSIHGASATHDYLRAAVAAGKRAVVTTSFDTGIGTALAMHLAALLPEPRPACGLDTLRFLEGDIVTGVPAIVDGQFSLSTSSGLGIKLDEAALENYATGPWREVWP